MDNKKTGKVLDALKSSRSKYHLGGHAARRGRRGTTYTPHPPHSKKDTAVMQERQKKAESFVFDHKKEKLIDYARRNKLPLPKKTETHVNDIKAYFAQYGLQWNDRGQRTPGRGSAKRNAAADNETRRKFADRMYALSIGEDVQPKEVYKPSGRHATHTANRNYEANKQAAKDDLEKSKQLFADRQVKVDADAKKAEEVAAQKVVRDKEVAARKAAAEAAKVKKAAAFKAAKKAEAAEFINPVTGLPQQTAGAPSGGTTPTPPESDANDSPVPGGETSQPKNDANDIPKMGYPEQNFPEGETMPKKTKDTSKGSAGGITASASQAGSVASIAPEGEAPKELAYTSPEAVVSKVAPALVDTEGTYTADEDITKLDSPKDITATTVVAPTMDALKQQGAVTKVAAPDELEAASYDAETLDTQQAVTAAKGTVSDKAIAKADEATLTERAVTAKRDTEAEQAAMAEAAEFDKSAESEVGKVTGEVAQVEETEEAETFRREAILGTPTPEGEAAEIMSMYDYNQSQQRAIQGIKAKDKAIKKLKSQGLKDDEIAKQLADNPELVADQMEDMPEDVRTTLSGLPQEALVDVQMESLLAGMEDGDIPAWAKPALSMVESKLAARGMSRSSVGRDALFNAVIQSAIPLAQSNAQAIQAATSQDKQIAADFLAKNAELKQQMDLANMSNDQQMRIANLSALNAASSDNLTAAQQTELANLNTRMQTNLTQAQIASQMNVAQLNVDQQRAVENAQTVARIDLAKFDAAQQVTLANSKFMQTMVQTEFNAEQQTMLQNATAMANMDMANADQRTKLAITNAQSFLQMDMTNLNNQQQANITKAQLNQQRLLSNQSQQNAAKQFNAKSEAQTEQFMATLGSQIEQFNSSAQAAREQFNAVEKNKRSAQKAGNKLEVERLNAQLMADINKFNAQQDFQRDQWNAANAQAIQQSNVAWRRQANLANTAAQNAANGQNVQIAYNMSSQEQTQLWQQMRDDAAYIRQAYENDEQRKSQLIATAISNEEVVKSSGGDVGKLLTIANTALDKPKDEI